jgi:hypothetical protein
MSFPVSRRWGTGKDPSTSGESEGVRMKIRHQGFSRSTGEKGQTGKMPDAGEADI